MGELNGNACSVNATVELIIDSIAKFFWSLVQDTHTARLRIDPRHVSNSMIVLLPLFNTFQLRKGNALEVGLKSNK